MTKRIRMRVREGRLEPLEEVCLPEGAEVMVDIVVPEDAGRSVVDALRASAGAWSDEAHPELETRDDVVQYVRELRGQSQLEMRNGFYVFTGEVDQAELDHRIDREERIDRLSGKTRS